MRPRGDNEAELLKGNTPTLILAVLAQAPRHGYAIAQAIKQRSAEALALGEGSLYPALKALERDGFVVGAWEERAGGAARRVYALTESGRAELARRQTTWRRFAAAIDRVLEGGPDVQSA